MQIDTNVTHVYSPKALQRNETCALKMTQVVTLHKLRRRRRIITSERCFQINGVRCVDSNRLYHFRYACTVW